MDDDESLGETLAIGLKRRGLEVTFRRSAHEAQVALGTSDFDVVVTDLNMREVNGIELCRRIVANRPDVPVVVLTAFGSLDTAIAAIRAGAYDFISKPVEIDALALAIDRAAAHHALREEVKRLRIEVGRMPRLDELVGQSPAMQTLCDLVERVADSDATCLAWERSRAPELHRARRCPREIRTAARILGVDRKHLYRMIDRLGLHERKTGG